jgi:hypothetical protein
MHYLRRTSLRVRIVAAIVAAAVVAAVVFVVVPSSPPPKPAYTSLPPAPCAVISLASLAAYLPHPTGTPETPPPATTYRTDDCKWSSTTGGEDRTLEAQENVYGSSSPVTAAQQAYNNTVSSLGGHGKGVAVSARPVTGLGDRATALFITVESDSNYLIGRHRDGA